MTNGIEEKTKFTAQEKETLRQDLDKTIPNWESISRYNQSWDTRFKIAVLLISILIAICSGLAAAKIFENTQLLSITATILAAISSAVAGFGFNQFNFSARQLVWKAKADELRNLRDDLLFQEPDKKDWFRLKKIVESWSDNTPLEQLQLSDSREKG